MCVLIFDRTTLVQVCQRLGKRHPNQDTTLQLTRRNINQLLAERTAFDRLGVKVFPEG